MSFNIKRHVGWFAAIFTVTHGIVLDQFTKRLAAKYLIPGEPTEIISGFFNLGLVRNKGAAFGIGNAWDPFWQKFFFLGVSMVAILLIAYLLYRHINESKFLVISISLILGGAIGNVYDRIVSGYVVDFIEIYYKKFHWPNFNIADALICVGVGMYLIHSFFLVKKEDSKEQKSAS